MLVLKKLDGFLKTIEVQKNWIFLLSLLLTVVAIFFAFPSYDGIIAHDWQPLFDKGAHPFDNGNFHPGSHASKLTFRLVVPIIVHLANLSITGCMLFFGLVGILNFYLVVRLAYKILDDKHAAAFIGLCTAFIYFGKCSFTEIRGLMFDGVCISFLLLALNTRIGIIRTLCIFLSAFTDERGLIASSLLVVYTFLDYPDKKPMQKLFNPQALFIYLAWVCYFSVRIFLTRHFGLITDKGGTGIHELLNQINNIPIGVWSALEGLWILLIYSYLLLYRDKKFFDLFIYFCASSLILLVGLAVIDITRSVVYIFPAVFIALKIIHKDPIGKLNFKRYLKYALILCFLYPAYYTGGKSSIWWSYPLPIQALRFVH